MRERSFTPRNIWSDDVMSDSHLEEYGDIYFADDVLRYYCLSDICEYRYKGNDKFLMVVMQDFDKNMMHFIDVTEKVKVDGEPL